MAWTFEVMVLRATNCFACSSFGLMSASICIPQNRMSTAKDTLMSSITSRKTSSHFSIADKEMRIGQDSGVKSFEPLLLHLRDGVGDQSPFWL